MLRALDVMHMHLVEQANCFGATRAFYLQISEERLVAFFSLWFGVQITVNE